MTEPLKPCPSPECKSENVAMLPHRRAYYGHCDACELDGPTGDTECGSKWNALPREDSIEAERVARLQKIIDANEDGEEPELMPIESTQLAFRTNWPEGSDAATWAMLLSGSRLRHPDWPTGQWVELDPDGFLVDEHMARASIDPAGMEFYTEPTPEPEEEDSLREQLADQEHERWAHWQKHLHSKCERNDDGSLTIPAAYAANLERQIATPYADLTKREKDSDRKEANKTLILVGGALDEIAAENARLRRTIQRLDASSEPRMVEPAEAARVLREGGEVSLGGDAVRLVVEGFQRCLINGPRCISMTIERLGPVRRVDKEPTQ